MEELNNVTISFSSEDDELSYEQSKSLRLFIEDDDISDKLDINQSRAKLKDDEAGGAILSVISVVIGSPLFGEFIKILAEWIKSKLASERNKEGRISIDIDLGDGRKAKFEADSTEMSEKEILDKLGEILVKR